MNIAEAHRMKALESQVEALTNRLKDVERRLDDFSKAERAKEKQGKKEAA